MIRKTSLAVSLALAAVVAAQAQVDDNDEPVSVQQSPTFQFIGDRYRVGVGVDSEFDFIGEFQASLSETDRSAWIGEGWLGREGAGGLKVNYHWLFNTTAEEGPDGPVYTDGRVAKLFLAADQNQYDDRKLTFGAGYEYRDWFFAGYGMTSLTDERLVNRVIDFDERLQTGTIDGRGFTRVDTIETITDFFEAPYDWGVGLRAGRYFDEQLVRLRGGLDYESGDFGSSQLTGSLSLDKHFANSPHSLSLRTSYYSKSGDFVDDRNDLRGSLVYSYSFGGHSHRPARQYRDVEVTREPEPRYEEQVVATEVTLSDEATFDFDSAELRPGARETLNELVEAIREGGLVSTIQVVGHTCDIGPEEYNQGLSERRAQSVVEYLATRGIETDEVDWEGRGLHEPRYPNDSEENRSRNRRVEISFVTEESRTERIQVGPDEPVTEIERVEVPVEAPWIRRALRNPVRHKRIVDFYRYQESTTSITEGDVVFDNQPPVANDNQFSVEKDSTDNALDVLANDSDPDGDPLSIIEVTQPSNGQAEIGSDVILYTPNSGFVGTDTFSYTIDDGFGGQATASVTVMVEAPGEPPVADDIEVSTERTRPVDVDVLAAASLPDGGSLEIASFSQPSDGSVTQVGNQLRYQPDQLFYGEDSFTYTVVDERGQEASATVFVDVAFANQAPVARPDVASAPAGVPVTVDVLANDFDPDGDPLEVISVQQISLAPAEAVINEDNTITFTISDTCHGTNFFRYTISDPFGATSTATVRVERDDSGTEGYDPCQVEE
ncbi:tandem-95 repeat protein [Wenzhouxiangella sp. AB-CW3]|uniref:Ig-like domain-containing protein n=1 Tax=Wenzhouxiangella sp. AB-CW3 TaxID=2771012 RepID=UPI00168B85A1|nr:Ig-like domain-containing protein [Wenzhouxiangella sp. AB-CW3]QOC21731.1 tandem-95 repeat protein [Wenzhouxiangella sp. AB-CW3]